LLLADEPDMKALRATDDTVARCERALQGLGDAAGAAMQQVKDAEQRLAAERDQQRRQGEADRVAAAISTMNEAHAAFRTAALPLAKALQTAGTQEAAQAATGLRGLTEYLANMVPHIAADLKSYAAGVLKGDEFMHRVDASPPPKVREVRPSDVGVCS
jgi:leucyl-tRNA synthetase